MGGCTTYLAKTIISSLYKHGYGLLEFPRLVRLNPNVRWKTRGNGAIALHIGMGIFGKQIIGEDGGTKILSLPAEALDHISDKDIPKIKTIVEKILETNAVFEDDNTNPGFVISKQQPPFEIYKRTVEDFVSLRDIKELIKSINAEYKGYKNCRGLIGATAAISWSPSNDKTYELITYRTQERWGTKRFVDDRSVQHVDTQFPSTFDNYDYENKHNRLVPKSPCPVLYGIRGENPTELTAAHTYIISEPIESWILFLTNQGTDDHLIKRKISDIHSLQSAIVEGRVVKQPYTIKGGHVILSICDEFENTIDCAAYEPTKQFRSFIRKLRVGDLVEVYGSVRTSPFTINIEKINIKYLTKQIEKTENPICSLCGKHMKSRGIGQGYRCKHCRQKSTKPLTIEKKREISKGFYEVPVCARRHLSKPLKRMKKTYLVTHEKQELSKY